MRIQQKNLILALGAALWISLIAVSWTQAAEKSSEYNFNWLDPDKKIYVLQNRRYVKAGRIMASAMAGIGISNAYRSTQYLEPRIAYYLSELIGIEVFYSKLFNSENATAEALRKTSPAAFPVVREINSQFGALLHYVPWYAKINVFNQILYFDWYFSAGAGQLAAELVTQDTTSSPQLRTPEDLLGVYLGTGHQYHLNETLTVRIDFSSSFYQAKVLGTSGENTWFSNYTFGIGVGARL